MAQKSGNMHPGNTPGKCYAKCLITSPSTFHEYEETFPIYVGDSPDSFNFEIIEIVTTHGRTEWVKKRAYKNCLGMNPNDCEVWSLKEVPPTLMEIEVLLDTSLTKDFVYETFLIEEETVQNDAHTEWRPVVCESNVSKQFIEDLQEALTDKGFFYEDSSKYTVLGGDLKIAFINFQKMNGLPIGQLDHETLEALDINIP